MLATVDNDGTMRSKALYRPYGELLNEWVSTDDKHRYTGKERDRELSSQWDYFGARYYIPGLKLFSSVDPQWSNTPGIGAYLYCADNPLKYTDPDGEFFWLAVMAAAAVYIAMTPDVAQAPAYEGDYVQPTTGEQAVQQIFAVLGAAGAAALTRSIVGGAEASAAADATAVRSTTSDFAENTARGVSSEARTLERMGLEKNTKMMGAADPKTGMSGKTMPDAIEPKSGDIVEIKDRIRVADSKQLRLQHQLATKQGVQHVLVTGKYTRVSQAIINRGTQIVRFDDLGPGM